MLHYERIEKIKYWLGPSTHRNQWRMEHLPGMTMFHLHRRQHFKHVMRKVTKAQFPCAGGNPVKLTLVLLWPDCAACGHAGTAHANEPPFACLFGPAM